MKQLSLLFLFSAMLWSSCSDDVEGELTLNFKLNYGDAPLVMFENVEYPDGRSFEFSRFSFYVSDVKLIQSGEAETIVEADYIDLTASHGSASSAASGFNYTIDYKNIPSFDQLQMNFGLNSQQNASTPSDHNSSSALSFTGEYWSGWESYVFVKIEGRIDIDNDGITDGVALHLGSDEIMRTLTIDALDSPQTLSFQIDVRKIFENNGEIFDIDSNSRIHSLDQMDVANTLMDNFISSMSITE